MPDTPEMTLEFTSIETAELARLKAEIKALKEAEAWIPVIYHLPYYDSPVLWCDCRTGEQATGSLERMRGPNPIVLVYHAKEHIFYQSNFTHWRPLPETPEREP